MTVQQLIDKLRKQDPKAKIVIDCINDYSDRIGISVDDECTVILFASAEADD